MAEVILPHGLLLDVADHPGVNYQASMYRSRGEANYGLQRVLDKVALPLTEGTPPTDPSLLPSYRTAISQREFEDAGFDSTEELRELMMLVLSGSNEPSASEVSFNLRLGGRAGELTNPTFANTTLGFSLAEDVYHFFPTLVKDPTLAHPDPFFFGWGRGIVGQDPIDHKSHIRIGVPFNLNQLNQEAGIVRSTINLFDIKIRQGNLEPVAR